MEQRDWFGYREPRSTEDDGQGSHQMLADSRTCQQKGPGGGGKAGQQHRLSGHRNFALLLGSL